MTDSPSTSSTSSASLGDESSTSSTLSESSTDGTISNSPLVSVIMPVYNVAPYLPTALKCLVNQTYTNLQILCIDDGSTDASATILDQYAKQDPRITVFHTENQGVALARNLGMQHVNGKYLCFVDPDDQWDLTLIEHMVFAAEQHDDDVVFASTKTAPVNDTLQRFYVETPQSMKPLTYTSFNSNDEFRSAWKGITSKFNVAAVWGKLFRTDFIRAFQPEFPHEVQTGTDTIFTLHAYTRLQRASYVAESTYYYTPRSNGICARYDNQFVQERFYIYYQAFQYFSSWNPEFSSEYATTSCVAIYRLFREQSVHRVPWNTQLQCMKSILQTAKWKTLLTHAQPQTISQSIQIAILRTKYIPLIFAACYAQYFKGTLSILKQ